MMWGKLKRLWRYDPLRRLPYWMQTPSDADRLADALRRADWLGFRVSIYERADGSIDAHLVDPDIVATIYYVERIETDPVRRVARAIEGALEKVEL